MFARFRASYFSLYDSRFQVQLGSESQINCPHCAMGVSPSLGFRTYCALRVF